MSHPRLLSQLEDNQSFQEQSHYFHAPVRGSSGSRLGLERDAAGNYVTGTVDASTDIVSQERFHATLKLLRNK